MKQDVETVWREHRGELKGYILKRVRSAAEAEDILHDVFLKMLSSLGPTDRVNQVRAWLFTVTRNAVADYYRSRRPTSELPEDLADHSLDVEGEPFEDIGSSLKPMLNALPEKIRAALVMADLEGLKQREVAERLGISLVAAKSRILRGRALVRRMIEECCHLEMDVRGRIMDYTVRDKGERHCCR